MLTPYNMKILFRRIPVSYQWHFTPQCEMYADVFLQIFMDLWPYNTWNIKCISTYSYTLSRILPFVMWSVLGLDVVLQIIDNLTSTICVKCILTYSFKLLRILSHTMWRVFRLIRIKLSRILSHNMWSVFRRIKLSKNLTLRYVKCIMMYYCKLSRTSPKCVMYFCKYQGPRCTVHCLFQSDVFCLWYVSSKLFMNNRTRHV